MDMRTLDRATAEQLYASHEGEPYYEVLMKFMTDAPIVAAKVEGPGAIGLVRKLMGATDPLKAEPGSIRGDYSNHVTWNLCHGSDTLANAEKELAILFPE
jgi:nucleoside-diphosphate kinase